MQAIGLSRYGGPEVLGPVKLPNPHPGEGQVRVRVRAAAVNPADVMLRQGDLADWYEDAQPPFIPGMDLAGEIDEIGPGVDPALGLTIGDPVVGVLDNHGQVGAYSELVVLPAASVTSIPDGTSFAEASSFLMNALTARNALDALNLPHGASVLVTGAAGAVGAYAVALAADDGLRVVATASGDDEPFVRALGACAFIARGDALTARVQEFQTGGVDAVIDAAGLTDELLPAIRRGGQIIDLRFWEGAPERGIRIVRVSVRDRVLDHDAIVRLRAQVECGALPLRVAATFPASAAADAHRAQDAGGLRGRVVITFHQGAFG